MPSAICTSLINESCNTVEAPSESDQKYCKKEPAMSVNQAEMGKQGDMKKKPCTEPYP